MVYLLLEWVTVPKLLVPFEKNVLSFLNPRLLELTEKELRTHEKRKIMKL